MIAKGLKVGDIFEDGGLAYEVRSVLPSGDYISKKIEKPVEKEIPIVEPTKEEVQVIEPTNGEKTYTRTDIKRMSKDALLVMAKENGIECNEETAGTEIKEALITKLVL